LSIVLGLRKLSCKIIVCDERGGDGSFLAGGKGVLRVLNTPRDASYYSIIPSVWIQRHRNQADESLHEFHQVKDENLFFVYIWRGLREK
jgi:hypothetical protein